MASICSSVYGSISIASLALRSAPSPLGADHEAVLAGEHRPADGAEDLTEPLVDGGAGELALLLDHPDERVAARHPGVREERVPPLAVGARIEGVDPAEGVALHELAGLALEPGDLVLADEGVAAHQVGRRDGRPHRVVGPYAGSHHSGLSSP